MKINFNFFWLFVIVMVFGSAIPDYRIVQTHKDGKISYSIEKAREKKKEKKPEIKKEEKNYAFN